MQRKFLTGAAAVAALAIATNAPADARSFKYRSGASASTSTFQAVKRRAAVRPSSPGQLSNGNQPQAMPGHAAAIYALSLYYRKCLDNMLPECPK